MVLKLSSKSFLDNSTKMEVNFTQIKYAIKSAENLKMPDLCAYVMIILSDESGREIKISGFTLRKSQYAESELYLTFPSKKVSINRYFKFAFIERSLFEVIQKEVIEQYKYENIPVIEESGKGGYKSK